MGLGFGSKAPTAQTVEIKNLANVGLAFLKIKAWRLNMMKRGKTRRPTEEELSLVDQMKYLFEANLYHRLWVENNHCIDPDQCEFCFQTLDDYSKLYYCTEDLYYWVCEECYDKYKFAFRWRVVSEDDDEVYEDNYYK
ncbi:MAG: hypothetical protein LBU69_05830 [Deltaproteobacteria bacterium]|nr:hypothetical protein [Deltaproteobacteria bacterium]